MKKPGFGFIYRGHEHFDLCVPTLAEAWKLSPIYQLRLDANLAIDPNNELIDSPIQAWLNKLPDNEHLQLFTEAALFQGLKSNLMRRVAGKFLDEHLLRLFEQALLVEGIDITALSKLEPSTKELIHCYRELIQLVLKAKGKPEQVFILGPYIGRYKSDYPRPPELDKGEAFWLGAMTTICRDLAIHPTHLSDFDDNAFQKANQYGNWIIGDNRVFRVESNKPDHFYASTYDTLGDAPNHRLYQRQAIGLVLAGSYLTESIWQQGLIALNEGTIEKAARLVTIDL